MLPGDKGPRLLRCFGAQVCQRRQFKFVEFAQIQHFSDGLDCRPVLEFGKPLAVIQGFGKSLEC